MIKVLNPTAGPARGRSGLAPRPATLDGKTVGVIWNGRAYGDRILSEALDLLKQRHRIGEVIFREKPFLGNIAPEEILAEMAARAHLVVTGVGDWGSCTSGSVLDAITMERRGVPAAAVGVKKLVETTGRGMCRAQGIAEYPIAVVDHPTGSLASLNDPALISRYAALVAEQVERILTTGRAGE